jgi:hypothetical protein
MVAASYTRAIRREDGLSRWGAVGFWAVLAFLGFGPWSPPSRENQGEWIFRLATFQWEGENQAVAAQFMIMGVWPLLTALLFADRWRSRPLPLWIFHVTSFVNGCYSLLPGIALSDPARSKPAPAWARHPLAPILLGLAGCGLLAYGLVAGDLPGFVHTFRTDGFVWAMTWDFFAFPLLFAIEARSRAHESRLPWTVTLVPIAGAAAWLARRR